MGEGEGEGEGEGVGVGEGGGYADRSSGDRVIGDWSG